MVLLDILPVGCLPSQRATTANGDCDAGGNTLSEMFNALLRTEMAKSVAASMPGMRYSIASLYNVFSDMIANPKLAGKWDRITFLLARGTWTWTYLAFFCFRKKSGLIIFDL